ncbi:MAG: RNA methyltransferase [Pseudomonadota bacterium]
MSFDDLLRHRPGEVRMVTSGANEIVKALRSLRLKKYRNESNLFIAEGARTLIEALELGHQPKAIAYLGASQDEPHVKRIIDAVKAAGGLCLEVNEEVLNKISERENPQTVVGVFEQRWGHLQSLQVDKQILVLEDIRDPGNLGTILRTCDGFGVTQVVLAGNCTDPYGIEAVRASMGSLFSIRLVAAEAAQLFDWLKNYQGEIVGTALQSAKDIRTTNWQQPHIIVMGNEQKGLSEDLRKCCTQLIKIPMRGRADSFNLAVATAITLYLAGSEA